MKRSFALERLMSPPSKLMKRSCARVSTREVLQILTADQQAKLKTMQADMQQRRGTAGTETLEVASSLVQSLAGTPLSGVPLPATLECSSRSPLP